MTEGLTDKEFHEAVDRIARTDDGHLLYLFLQKRLMAILASTDSGALQSDHGERRFAAKLIALMGKGIQDSDGRSNAANGDTSGGPPSRAIVFASSEHRAVNPGRRGVGRRVTADQYVDGWDSPRDDPAG